MYEIIDIAEGYLLFGDDPAVLRCHIQEDVGFEFTGHAYIVNEKSIFRIQIEGSRGEVVAAYIGNAIIHDEGFSVDAKYRLSIFSCFTYVFLQIGELWVTVSMDCGVGLEFVNFETELVNVYASEPVIGRIGNEVIGGGKAVGGNGDDGVRIILFNLLEGASRPAIHNEIGALNSQIIFRLFYGFFQYASYIPAAPEFEQPEFLVFAWLVAQVLHMVRGDEFIDKFVLYPDWICDVVIQIGKIVFEIKKMIRHIRGYGAIFDKLGYIKKIGS